MMRKLYFLLILMMALTTQIKADESHVYRLIDSADGLPDNEVKAMLHLPDGRLGIRTSSCFSLYDGCEFFSFTPRKEVAYPMPYVASLPTAYTDGRQRVWLKEAGHLLAFDLTGETYINKVEDLLLTMGVKEQIRNFFIDSTGDYWTVTISGKLLWIHDRKQTKESYRCETVKVRTQGLRDICRTQGHIWLVYSDGWLNSIDLVTRKPAGSQRLWQGNVSSRDFVQFSSREKHCWLMWNHGIAIYNPVEKRWQLQHEDAENVFTTISVAPDGKAYIAVRKQGLLTIPPQGAVSAQTAFTTNNGKVIKDDVEAIVCGKSQVLLGFFSQGICQYNANMQQFPFYAFRDMTTGAATSYRFNDSFAGTVQFTGDDNIFLWNGAKGMSPLLNRKMTAGSDFINSYTDSRGRLWIGTFRHGLYMKHGEKVLHLQQGENTADDINYNIVRGFVEDHRHRIWVNFHGGIGFFDEKIQRIVPLKDKRLAKYKVVNAWATDKGNTLWMATSSGLLSYSTESGKLSLPQDIVDDKEAATKLEEACKALLVDSKGHIWVGQLNGLYIIDPKRHTTLRYGKEQGMPNEMIQGIAEDSRGDVWVSTANGLCRLHHSGEEYTMIVFDSQNWLKDCKFMSLATAHAADGRLLFGCAEGFYAVDPASVKTSTYAGHPILTSLTVNRQSIVPGREYDGRIILEKAISQTQKIVLRHDENFISLRFSGLNFDMPNHTHYKYRLKGLEDHWTETSPTDGIGRAAYTKLPPGEYELEVCSAGFNMQWSKQKATLSIVVEAPLWATWWAKTIYLLIIAGAVSWGIRWKMEQKRKQMEDEKHRELEDMKLCFFTNISHEFRTLLTLIITPIGTLLHRATDTETRKQLNTVSKNAGDLLQLVNELLDFRKMEMGGERLRLTVGNMDEFVKYTVSKFTPLAEQKNIAIEMDDRTGGLFMMFDRDKMGKILVNLLSNAFKYTKSGRVRVVLEKCLKDSRHYASIRVEDTGCGISKNDRERIFDRFFRVEDQTATNVGSGIGLNLVAEYVKLHDGHIHVESEVGKGSCFTVEIPADLKKVRNEEPVTVRSEECGVRSENELNTEKHPTLNTEHSTLNTKHSTLNTKHSTLNTKHSTLNTEKGSTLHKTVLVVEDNDDFRNFLVRELSHRYSRVLEADDGLKGAIAAEEELPDIIVSDVMMPRLSGTDMCRRLKETLKTSHIPVILLTAWSTDEGRADGYKAGADAYIAKPFDMDVLLARITNILEKQEKRMNDFSHSLSLDASSVAESSLDESLLKKMMELIEQNISNTDYTIDSMAKDMLMSRMSLHRKIKALTGQTPADFIRTVRLKYAAQLLESGKYNVAEVGYKTGFASPQNFTKHFKEMFGTLPSQYKKQQPGM